VYFTGTDLIEMHEYSCDGDLLGSATGDGSGSVVVTSGTSGFNGATLNSGWHVLYLVDVTQANQCYTSGNTQTLKVYPTPSVDPDPSHVFDAVALILFMGAFAPFIIIAFWRTGMRK